MAERLQKLLAHAGVTSRRAAEDLIRQGRVTVDGAVATLGQSVEPGARVTVDGTLVQSASKIYLALNKPAGYVTSLRSTHGERMIMDLVQLPQRVFPVGRLDKDTTGLLFLTNDGDWANAISHPRAEVAKEYRALVRGAVGPDLLRQLRAGVTVGEERYVPASVRPMANEGGNTWLEIVLTEGRKREIRIMMEAVGHAVLYLERVRIGEVRLGHLPAGRWRELSKREVESFYGGKGGTGGVGVGTSARAGPGDAPRHRHRRTGGGRQVKPGPRARRHP